jgi:hypothetical protein
MSDVLSANEFAGQNQPSAAPQPSTNPNIGQVVTAPSGATVDMTQATKSPSTMYPTSGPNAVINEATGQAMQPRSKAEQNVTSQAFQALREPARAEMREYTASVKAIPLETKMRETGRPEAFIQAHKNDTPEMQVAFNKAYKANPGPNMTVATAPKPTAMKANPTAPTAVSSSKQFKPAAAAVKPTPYSMPVSAGATATMTTPATGISGKAFGKGKK